MTAQPTQPGGLGEIVERLVPGESKTMAELRLSVRDTIARGIMLVLDRERLLRRISEVIADGTGYPAVVIYIRNGDALQSFELGSRTSSVAASLPKRLPRATLEDYFAGNHPVVFNAFPGLEGEESTLGLGLYEGSSLIGAVVIFDARQEAFDDEDLRAIKVVGEEISPAIAAAARHHQIQEFSVLDIETGAHTAAFFDRRLNEEISRGQRSGTAHAIILLHIVGFDDFESRAGYAEADAILRRLAETVTALTRTSDVVARYRRTGFSLLLPESDSDGVEVALQRIQERASKLFAEIHPDDGQQSLKIASGWAIFPTDGVDGSSLVLAAEQRLLASETDLGER